MDPKPALASAFAWISATGSWLADAHVCLSVVATLAALIASIYAVRAYSLRLTVYRMERDKLAAELCEECREGNPPNRCPYTENQKPKDCPYE